MSLPPSLPAPYEPLHLAETDSVRDDIARRAHDGADEGLLLWASHQRDARGRLGKRWLCAPGDLACAVLLRPDFSRASAAELSLVACDALGHALAELVAPQTSLHYQWPNDVLLNGNKVASVWLDAPPDGDPPAWLALSLAVNVDHHPEADNWQATSVNSHGEEPISGDDILANFSRHLLAALNRWAEDGLGVALRTWRARIFDIGEDLCVTLPDQTLKGPLLGLDDDGALRMTVDGVERRIGLAEVLALLPPAG